MDEAEKENPPIPSVVKPDSIKPSSFLPIKKPEQQKKTIEVKEERTEPKVDQFAPIPVNTAPIGNMNVD